MSSDQLSNDSPATKIPSNQPKAGGPEDRVSSVVRDVLFDSAGEDRRNIGGTHSHKPDCRCRPCTARRRQAEALARGDRLGPSARDLSRQREDALNADLPKLHAHPNGIRQRVSQYLELRILNPGITIADCARKMGISPNTLYSYIQRATKQGWLVFDNPIERLDNEIIPKALDNVAEFLDQKDKQVTIEVAKGALFPAYKEAKGISEGQKQTLLAIKFEMPPGSSTPSTQAAIEGEIVKPLELTGNVVGRPKVIE